MCGREPNFELTSEEKDELSKLSWDDFLTMTRSAINNKSNLSHSLLFILFRFSFILASYICLLFSILKFLQERQFATKSQT